MPHLQDESEDKHRQNEGCDAAIGSPDTKCRDSVSGDGDFPIQEARKGYLGTSDPGVTALANKVSAAAMKVESFESTEANTRSPAEKRCIKPVITPSSSASDPPLASPSRSSPSNGPILTVYGNKSLFPSPIRVKRRVSQSEDDDEEQIVTYQHTHQVSAGRQLVNSPRHVGKRCVSSDQDHYSDNSNRNVEGTPAKKLRSKGGDVSVQTGKVSDCKVPKKRIISPTSSGDKGSTDDHTNSSGRKFSRGPTLYEKNMHPQGSAHYRPHPASIAFGGVPPFGVGYPVYHGYPPHGLPHAPPFMTGHLHGHPSASSFFPPYHHGAAPMMHQYNHSHPYFPSHHRIDGAPAKGAPPLERSKDGEGRGNIESFKSVSDWQQAALSAGKPPSANRCVPLKDPVPSKYWGEADKTTDLLLPDFHRLVNYPDYLTKSRNGAVDGTPSGSSGSDGKKNCVMCGELRICSATSLINKGRALKADEYASISDGDGECAHIIPRQNKGLCTNCDVTVWVVVADGLEIKWCKGCKNFRPWAAFGDKGGATKCVRCRDRQREKYALQKDVVRPRKYRQDVSSPSFSSSSSVGEKKEEESHVADAACGLRNLMNAAATAV